MGISKEQIWATADELEAKGVKPTLRAVRKALGGGSYETISEAMSDRRKGREEAQVAPVPSSLEEKLSAFGRQVWSAAMTSANERLDADRDQFNKASAGLKEELNDALELATHTTADLDSAHREIQQHQASIAALNQDGDDLRDRLNGCQQRLAAMTAQLAESEQRARDLNRQLDQLQAAHSDLIRALPRNVSYAGTQSPSSTASSISDEIQ